MLARNDWLMPSNNEIPRIQKPPLLYWMIMAGTVPWKTLGLDTAIAAEVPSRVPNALGAIGCILVAAWLGTQIGGQRLGWAAAATLSGMGGFFIFSRLIMPEPVFGALVGAAIGCFIGAWQNPAKRWHWFLTAWIAMGLACFSKGIHGALWPLGSAALCALVAPPSRPFWKGLWHPWGILIFWIILIPWYVLMEQKLPGFWKAHFGDEQVALSMDMRSQPTSTQVPLGAFLLQHLVLWMPGLLFAPAAAAAWWKGHRTPKPDNADEQPADMVPVRMVCCWVALTFVTSSFSARQDYYTLSCWPGVAVALALAWTRGSLLPRRWLMLPSLLMAVAGILGLILSASLPSLLAGMDPTTATFEQRGHVLDAIQGLSPSVWMELRRPLTVTALFLLLGGLGANLAASQQRPLIACAAVAFGMIGPLTMAAKGMAVVEDFFSLKSTAQTLQEKITPASWVVYDGEPNLCSSLYFYLPHRIHLVHARADAEFGPRVLGWGREYYLSETDFAEAWRSERPVYLITEENAIPTWTALLKLTPAQQTPVARSGTRITLLNH
jgi:hypothetical protein